MKKFYCLIIFSLLILLPGKSRSQNYIPMLNDSLYWDVAYASMSGSACQEYGGGGPYRFAIHGDTIINGLTYLSFNGYLFTSIWNPVICPPFTIDTIPLTGTTFALLREDTISKKVYSFDTQNNQEYLIFDFDAQIGDSILYQTSYFYVDTIYPIVTQDGVTRQMFEYKTSPSLGGYYIEGLGGTGGPFYPPFHYFETGPWLMCVSKLNQQPVYTVDNCYSFITGLTSLNGIDKSVKISPNPVLDKFRVENIALGTELIIYNSFGQEISNMTYNVDEAISVEGLTPGLYFLFSIEKEKLIQTGRFIKL